MKRHVDPGDVHEARPSREDRVVGRQVAACAVAAERPFDEIGPLQAQRFEDALSQGVAEARAGRLLDEEAKHDVVAAVIGPSVAGREQAWLLQHELELVACIEPPATIRVVAIRLEERDGVSHEVVEAARVIQELANRDLVPVGDEAR